MHRTLGDGYVVDSGKRIYADEDPPTRDATQVRHEEMNSLQEEIANVIEAESITLNTPTETIAQMNQLNTAINTKVSNAVAAEAAIRSAADIAEASARAGEDINLANAIAALASSDIANDSSVSGAKVKDALNNLLAAISVQIPRGYIAGLTHGCSGSSCSFSPGICKDATDNVIIENSSSMTKDISSSWVQGTGNGGFGGDDGGPNADTWYYTFALYKSGQPTDFGFDNDPTGSNLLTASTYTHARRVGAVYYQSDTNLRTIIQKGDYFLYYNDYLEETLDLNTGSSGFKAGTLKVIPDQIDADIVGISCALSPPANNDLGSGVYVNIWANTMAGGFADKGSVEFYDAKYDSNREAMPMNMKHIPETSNLTGVIMLLSASTPSVACNITYRCFGYMDRRGRDD